MFLHKVKSQGLASLSYVVGQGTSAAVIDPRRDCQAYLDLAAEQGARIEHIFETHRNEDFVSGALELAERTGATIHHGQALDFQYGTPVSEGDTFDVGSVKLAVLETPGHTFESISITLADTEFAEDPVAVFTGDALFIGDVGRTDFFPDRAREVAGLLYDSITEKLLPLGDHVVLYPAHGAGSVCGNKMARREVSTLGYERRHNPSLQAGGRDEFIQMKLGEVHYQPRYFRKMEEYNKQGPPIMGPLPQPAPLTVDEFARAVDEGMVVVDTRSPEAYASVSIPNSLALPLEMLPAFAGYFLDYDQPIGLVLESSGQLKTAVRYLVRMGYDDIKGFLSGGIEAWQTAGKPYQNIPAMHVNELRDRLDEPDLTVLDVRSAGEYQTVHLPGVHHVYTGVLPEELEGMPGQGTIVTLCDSGRRALIAASVLRREGHDNVENCFGSMAACAAVGCEMEKG